LDEAGDVVLGGLEGGAPFAGAEFFEGGGGDGADAGAFHAGDGSALVGGEEVPEVVGGGGTGEGDPGRGAGAGVGEEGADFLGEFLRLDGAVDGDVFDDGAEVFEFIAEDGAGDVGAEEEEAFAADFVFANM
jgi:hypothetical protein